MSDTTTGAEAPAALPGDALRERAVDQVRTALGEALVDSVLEPGRDLWIRVTTEAWPEAGRVLRDVVGCEYFCFLSAIDWMPSPYGRGEEDPSEEPVQRPTEIRPGVTGGDTRMQVFARVHNLRDRFGVTIKADVPDEQPAIGTWIGNYLGANWHEREAHEMFGIHFTGHPDLRHLYLPSGFEGNPLRKDFPLLSRLVKPWPGIVDVEPLPGDDAEEGGGE